MSVLTLLGIYFAVVIGGGTTLVLWAAFAGKDAGNGGGE
jgi:hypothetical protein